MKQIKVLRRCFFNDRFYSADDGVVACDSDAAADRLIRAGLAEDAGDDFAAPEAEPPAVEPPAPPAVEPAPTPTPPPADAGKATK